MSTADGKPTKTNEEILRENESTRSMVLTHIQELTPAEAIMADLQLSIYERLGDIWLWAKERR